jgi:hypothetical protein
MATDEHGAGEERLEIEDPGIPAAAVEGRRANV